MPRSRIELHEILKAQTGLEAVYFQPPPDFMMSYPCVVYQRDYADLEFADNLPYNRTKRYQVTVIDENPDSPYPDMIMRLPYCSFNRFYVSDNLNHDVFNLYF